MPYDLATLMKQLGMGLLDDLRVFHYQNVATEVKFALKSIKAYYCDGGFANFSSKSD